MKLTIELVPSTSFYTNVRSMKSKQDWDIIRRNVYKEYNYKCGICDATGILDSHEIWSYNYVDNHHFQKLDGMIALCKMCHHIKHLGFAGILARQGKLDFDSLIRHFMAVNCCTYDEFLNHQDVSFMLWEERSKHQWSTDISSIEKYLDVKAESDMKNRECPDCRGKKTTSISIGMSRLTQKCYWCDGTGMITDCDICKGNGRCDYCMFGAVPDVDVDRLKIWVSTTHDCNMRTKELQQMAIEARKRYLIFKESSNEI